MSNEFEQPVEPMSRAEEILREENVQRPMSRVEDLLQQLVASGSNVTVTPTLNTGVPLAYVTINGVEETIYAPEDVVGSIVTVSPTYDTGTLVATITVNDVPYYIYVPENDKTVIIEARRKNGDTKKITFINGEKQSDIAELIDNGKFIIFKVWSSNGLQFSYFYSMDYNYTFACYTELSAQQRIICESFMIRGNNVDTFVKSTEHIYNTVPDNFSSAGKTLISSIAGGVNKWVVGDFPTELPSVTSSDEGKVLTVDSNGAWGADNVPSELPAVTSSDEGKVLTVDSNGAWGANNPSGGLPEVTSSDNDKILSVVNGIWDKAVNDFMMITVTALYDMSKLLLPAGITSAMVYQYVKNGKVVILFLNKNNRNFYFYPVTPSGTTVHFASIDYSTDSIPKEWTVSVYTSLNNTSNEIIRKGQWNTTIVPVPTNSSDAGKSIVVNSNREYVLQTILPSVTSSDEGKVLTVNSSGQWVASTIPDGTNTSY